ncbi:MAG: hypothetical protein AAF623_02550 [Planctomycetota bacterium]
MSTEETQPCPQCGAPLDKEAVLCIACGFHRQKGLLQVETGLDIVDPEDSRTEPTGFIAGQLSVQQWKILIGLCHVASAFGLALILIVFRQAIEGDYLLPSRRYTYAAFELILPSLILGILFCNTATYPARGFIGIGLAYLVLVQFMPLNPPFAESATWQLLACAGVSVVPLAAEVTGIICGRWVDENLR